MNYNRTDKFQYVQEEKIKAIFIEFEVQRF